MKQYILEACVDSVASALAAAEGGATRLELCGNLIIGGTTPDLALFREIRKYTDIPIRVLLRPRFGDFCYDEYEYQILLENVAMFKDAEADGVVIGCMNPNGTLNIEQMEGLVREAGGIGVTLHRAIDMSRDGLETLRAAKAIGVDTILTSGMENDCRKGSDMIRKMVEAAGDDMTILVGAGVSAAVISELYEKTGAKAYHMSGKVSVNSPMTFRRENVSMGLPGFSEYEIWQTSSFNIRKAKEVLERLF